MAGSRRYENLSGATLILPEALTATTEEETTLPSGDTVAIPKALISFDVRTGDVIPDVYGCEAVLDVGAEKIDPRLAILKILQSDAWSGIWIDTASKTRVAVDSYEEVAEERDKLLQKIYKAAGSNSGCFDIFAWDGSDVLFVQAKRAGVTGEEDRYTPTKWLQAALEIGLTLSNFLIIEWELGG